jgi:hypothetical protein
MQITIDTSNLSELDKSMLAFLAGGDETEEEPEEPAAPAPKTRSPKAQPAPEPEPEDEDLLGGSDDSPTLEQAVARATQVVSEGGTATVKAALASVGAKKVSELSADKVADFMAALDAAE